MKFYSMCLQFLSSCLFTKQAFFSGQASQTVCEVFAQLHIIGLELERMQLSLYTGVCRQVRHKKNPFSNVCLGGCMIISNQTLPLLLHSKIFQKM